MTHEADLSEFIPPHNEVAEKCLLGGVILSTDAYFEVASIVSDRWFYSSKNRQVWLEIKKLREGNRGDLDIVILRDELQKSGQLEFVGETYLLELFQTVPHADHTAHYAGIVREKFQRREGLRLIEETGREFRDLSREPQETIAALDGKLVKLSGDSMASDAVSVDDSTDETLAAISQRIDDRQTGKSVGIPTGSKAFDDLMGGLRPTELVIVAARPAMGKTALVCNWTLAAARAGHGSLVFSLEQGRTELHERFLSIDGRVDAHKLRIGDIDEVDSGELQLAANRIRQLPILTDDTAGRKVSEISAIARTKVRTHDIKLVIVDYLQLIEAEDPRMPREQQVSTITRRLKCLAKDLRIPVVALAQLNRDVESRDSKRPRLSDLRESGAIEQDADCVVFIHRPEVYDANDRPGEADLILAKNRAGRVGTVALAFAKTFLRFEDLAQPDEWGD
jgi:replicative DNA helicase